MFQATKRPDLADLRRRLAALAPRPGADRDAAPTRLALGAAEIDAVLGGGVVRDALHEISGPGASVFAALLAGKAAAPTAWIASAGRAAMLFPYGLKTFELCIENVIFISTNNPETFWAFEQALRSGAVGAAVAEAPAAPDFTRSRRLQLAARETGTLALLLAPDRRPARHAPASAADTRWRVAPRPGGDAPRYVLELLKNKSGSLGRWEATWDAAAHRFHLAAPV